MACRLTILGDHGEGITDLKVNLTPTQSGTPWQSDEVNNAPYVFRQIPMGNREWNKLVGGTVAWNQLCNNGTSPVISASGVTFTVSNGTVTANGTATANSVCYINGLNATPFISGHKYLMRGCPSGGSSQTYFQRLSVNGSFVAADTGDGVVYACSNTGVYTGVACFVVNGTSVSNKVFKPQLTDLTQMFGSTIADYVYSLEQNSAGSGIQWLKSYDLIDDQYHAYSQGALESVNVSAHKMVGKNQFSKVLATEGYRVLNTGATQANANYYLSDYIRVAEGETYYLTKGVGNSSFYAGALYDAGKNFITAMSFPGTTPASGQYVVPSGVSYVRLNIYKDYVDEVQFEIGSTATTYAPYTSTTYPIDSSVILRGMLKKDASNNLYYDGDEYLPDGTVTRKWGEVKLKGADTEGWSLAATYGSVTRFDSTSIYHIAKNGGACFSNLFPEGTAGTQNKELVDIHGGDGHLIVQVSSSIASTMAEWKTYLSTHNLEVVYELATQTTESADPYTALQVCDPDGTEEYIDYGVAQGTRDYAVPVGHESTYAMAYPIEGVDSFTVTADDGTTHTYPVSIGTTIYKGTVDVLDESYVSEMTNIASYNGETIGEPWLSSLDEYSAGATPTTGAQVVYTSTPTEGSVTVTGDPSTLSGISSVTSDKGQVEWSELAEITGKTTLTIIKP